MENAMCKAPIRLPNGATVICTQCGWCKANRVNDFAGRAVAEKIMSTAALSLTLTYAGGFNAHSLHYKDVQRMLYRLRNDGYSVRYFCCGEHGEKKGRAHWHIVLFFRGKVPDIPLGASRYMWEPYWSHGFTYAQSPDFDGMRYVLKYTLKDEQSRAFTKVLRLSKKPPIGYEYFQTLASDLVDRHLPLSSPSYSFVDIRGRAGRPIKFWLTGRSRELFMEGYVRMWRERHGTEPPMHEFLVAKYFDPIARREVLLDAEDFEKHLASKVQYRPRPKPIGYVPPPKAVGYMLLPKPSDAVLVKLDNGFVKFVPNDKGEASWQVSISAKSAIDVLMREGRMTLQSAHSVAAWGRQVERSTGGTPPG